ncbi:MAG: arsenate reductase ArsC [Desulfobulbus sp.]|nr:MAG: arsenate reductase ArsC [Desulfobulbus sp.]
MIQKTKILFLCTGNSCRSQMAEGWAKHLKNEAIDAWSAGIEKHGMNQWAIKVMAEAGVDISGHHSKLISELDDQDFDYVVTVCDHAHESCPLFPGQAKIIHKGFDDPPRLASGAADDEEALEQYRRVRDEIRDFIMTLPESLPGKAGVVRHPPGNHRDLTGKEDYPR